jgi:hypothetical protein
MLNLLLRYQYLLNQGKFETEAEIVLEVGKVLATKGLFIVWSANN